MTQYCVIGDNTLILVFQLDSTHTHIEDDALVVSIVLLYIHPNKEKPPTHDWQAMCNEVPCNNLKNI